MLLCDAGWRAGPLLGRQGGLSALSQSLRKADMCRIAPAPVFARAAVLVQSFRVPHRRQAARSLRLLVWREPCFSACSAMRVATCLLLESVCVVFRSKRRVVMNGGACEQRGQCSARVFRGASPAHYRGAYGRGGYPPLCASGVTKLSWCSYLNALFPSRSHRHTSKMPTKILLALKMEYSTLIHPVCSLLRRHVDDKRG